MTLTLLAAGNSVYLFTRFRTYDMQLRSVSLLCNQLPPLIMSEQRADPLPTCIAGRKATIADGRHRCSGNDTRRREPVREACTECRPSNVVPDEMVLVSAIAALMTGDADMIQQNGALHFRPDHICAYHASDLRRRPHTVFARLGATRLLPRLLLVSMGHTRLRKPLRKASAPFPRPLLCYRTFSRPSTRSSHPSYTSSSPSSSRTSPHPTPSSSRTA